MLNFTLKNSQSNQPTLRFSLRKLQKYIFFLIYFSKPKNELLMGMTSAVYFYSVLSF